jgi:hypothetical protein
MFFPNLSLGGKKQVIWHFPRVSDILSAVWIIASRVPGCGVAGSGFQNFCSVLLAIVELLPDEQSDDMDWLDIPWFGALFKLQNMPLTR